MRIIGGKRRGARLTTPDRLDVRPTLGRVREALFNVLDGGRFGSPYRNQIVVDAFAGSGALGLEALSRGGGQAIFLENAIPSRKALHRNIRALGFDEQSTVIESDATRLRRAAPETAGLILMDPPYGSDLAIPCLQALKFYGWASPNTVVVLELSANDQTLLPDWLVKVDVRRYGRTELVFLRIAD